MEKLPVTQQEKKDIPIVKGVLVPETFDQLWRVSCMMADSGLMTKEYEKNPNAVMVACQFGAQLGLSLMASIQNIAVVNGHPTLWGDSMLALVKDSNQLDVFVEYFSGEYEKDAFCAVCIAKRKGMGSEYNPEDSLDLMQRKGIIVNTFSIADAKRAGVWGGTGKEEWQKKMSAWYKHPKRMMKMRARAFTLRDGWPDILKGMHAQEEMVGEVQDLTRNDLGQYEVKDEEKIDLSAGVSLYGEKPVKKDPKPKKEDTDKEIQSKFDKMLDDIEYDEISLADYMNYVCDRACVSSIEVMKSAIVDFKAFYEQYRAWISREVEPAKRDFVDATFDNPPEKPETEPEPAGARNPLAHNGPPAGVRLDGLPKWGEDHPWWRDNWIKMKTAGYKGFVEDNRKALDSAPEPIQTEAKGKYLALYKEPMDTEETPKGEERTEDNQEEENKTWEKDISDSGPAPSPRERLINEMSLKGIKDQDVISDVDLYVKEYSEAAGQTKNEIILEILGDLTKFLKRFVTWRSLMKKTDLSGASQETVDEEIEKKQTMVSSRGILVEAGIALKRQNPELWSKACEALGFAPLPVANLEDEELNKIIKMVKKDADSPF
jgi:hypothetical protein